MQKLLRLYFLLAFLAFGWLDSAKAQCTSFYDGFESGSLGSQWLFGTSTYTRNVLNTGSAVGTYHFQHLSTAGAFYQGTYAIFTPAQPTYFSFWMRTNTTTAANGYVVIGNSAIGTDNGILFCYFNNTSQLRFFGTTGYNHPISANTWYHVEARNVNWTLRTMDIWVNNVLILPSWPFRSTTAMNVDRVHLFNLNGADVRYDEIQIGIGGPAITNINTVTPQCFGDTTGSIDLTTTSTNGSLAYSWSNGANTQDVNNLVAGTYVVSITDSLGCAITDSIPVTGPTQIIPLALASNVVCPGAGSGALDVTTSGGSPGYSFTWSTGDTLEDVGNLMGGTYTLTVTDANGCTSATNFMVTEPAPFASSAQLTAPLCAQTTDGAIDYSLTGGTGPYMFSWTTGDTTEDISNLAGGTYTVVVTDSAGCMYSDTILLNPGAGVNASFSFTEPACFGFGNGSVSLTPGGGTPVYTYLWNTGATSQNLPATTAGTYIVTVTDANGCITVDSVVVTQPSALTSSVTSTPSTGSANGAIDLTVSGGTPPYTYLWSNGAATQDLANVTGNQNYSVIVTDANGCQLLDTVFVDDVIAVSNALGSTVSAWPNPFEGGFTVEVHAAGLAPIDMALTDLTGRQLWTVDGVQTGRIDVALDLPSGVYLLRVRQGESQSTHRLMRK